MTIAGSAVGEALNGLTTHYPDLSKDATAARDGDTISLVPSNAGGSALAAPPAEMALSQDEILRYSRHLIIPEVGIEGQQKLKAAKVLLVGRLLLYDALGMRFRELRLRKNPACPLVR